MQWELILLVVVAVLFGVLVLHLISDFVRNRWRAYHRHRQLLANVAVTYKRLEGGRGSGEESECEETSLLICDLSERREHKLVAHFCNL